MMFRVWNDLNWRLKENQGTVVLYFSLAEAFTSYRRSRENDTYLLFKLGIPVSHDAITQWAGFTMSPTRSIHTQAVNAIAQTL